MSGTDRQRGLQEAKLKALVRSIPDDPGELILADAPGSAGGTVTGAGASRGFLLAASDPKTGSQLRMLGPAMIWADSNAVKELNVFTEPEFAGALARRAQYFDGGWSEPSATQAIVWAIRGTMLVRAEPEELALPPELDLDVLEFAPTMRQAGTRPVDDHGRLVGEVAGLEVARVSQDQDGAYLEVGVGRADRELQMLVHGGLDRTEALERAAGMVLEHRYPNAPLHPLNRLARERWLRSEILNDPSLVGLVSAEPLAPLRPRSTLLGTEPSAALGLDPAGNPVVVVCSVGVDVDLAAEAAEYRARNAPDAELFVVVPEKDQHPAVVRTIEKLNRATLRSFPPPWGTPL